MIGHDIIMIVTVTILHNSFEILFLHIFHKSDSSATQCVFNLKSQSKS